MSSLLFHFIAHSSPPFNSIEDFFSSRDLLQEKKKFEIEKSFHLILRLNF
jgi:hypothetical protein